MRSPGGPPPPGSHFSSGPARGAGRRRPRRAGPWPCRNETRCPAAAAPSPRRCARPREEAAGRGGGGGRCARRREAEPAGAPPAGPSWPAPAAAGAGGAVRASWPQALAVSAPLWLAGGGAGVSGARPVGGGLGLEGQRVGEVGVATCAWSPALSGRWRLGSKISYCIPIAPHQIPVLRPQIPCASRLLSPPQLVSDSLTPRAL